MASVSEQVPFGDLCKVLNSHRTKRKEVLSKFIESWRKAHEKLHKDDKNTDDSFYPALRLILPSFDKDRGSYGFKEHMLAKRLIEILGLAKESPDALKLVHYRAPTSNTAAEIGDFAEIASNVIGRRISADHKLTIAEVNNILDIIADANADSDKKTQNLQLESLCRKARKENEEIKWIIRILLKQMKIGMQETTVLNLFHPEASQLYDTCTSLLEVSKKLRRRDAALDVISIQLFQPFRPMLANRVTVSKVPTIMNNGEFYIETKYDGERVQLHKRGDSYKYYSRNGNEYTNSYGGSPSDGGSLTPYIHHLFQPNVDSCILDGEMLGWDTETECINTKGNGFDVKWLQDGENIQPCFVPFDCVYLNGEVLTQKPLSYRLKEVLLNDNLFTGELKGRLIFPVSKTVSTKESLVSELNLAIERREEGIVVKRPDSKYRLNTRSNEGGWLKIKPDYVDSMCDDLDLVIVGGYFGTGHRANLMSHFLLALPKSPKDGEKVSEYVTVCKVGSGYSLTELRTLNLTLNQMPLIKPKDGGGRTWSPSWLQCASERPEVFIHPDNSKVLQIRAAEIIPSSSYAVGYTLRFPRVERIREDKDVGDATSTDQFNQLRIVCHGFKKVNWWPVGIRLNLQIDSEGKLAGGNLAVDGEDGGEAGSEEGGSPRKKARRGGGRVKQSQPTLPSHMQGADLRAVKAKTDVLKDQEYCILNGTEEETKAKLEIQLRELGAKIVQNPGSKTHCCIAGRSDPLRVSNIIKSGKHNVAKASWALKIIQDQKLSRWSPQDLWFATPETERNFGSDFDKYGDSYTEHTNVDQLREVLAKTKPAELTYDQLAELKREVLGSDEIDEDSCLTGLKIHVFGCHPKDDCLAECEVRMFGGLVVKNLDSVQPSHVIVLDDISPADLHDLNERNRGASVNKFHIVTRKWLSDSLNSKTILSDRAYAPNKVLNSK